MKARFIAALLCVVIPSSLALAEEATGPYIEGGQKGLLFLFNGLSTIGADNYLPNGVGAELYLSKVMALRAGVQFATASTNVPLPSTVSGTDGSASQTVFGVAGDMLFHLTSNRVSPYIGAGVLFQTSSNSYTAPTVGTGLKNETDDYYDSLSLFNPGLTLDVHAIIGVEFFITRNVSLSAEYHFGWDLFSPFDETDIVNGVSEPVTPKGATNTFGFMTNSGQLSLGFYF